MQKIPLKFAKPGMVLAKAILRDNGLVLVAEGTELSDSLVFRLENMQIDKIVVEGHPVDLEGLGGNTSFGKRLERLDHLFRNYEKDEWMQKLKSFLKHYFTIRAAQESAQHAEEDAESAEAESESSDAGGKQP